MTDAKSSKEWPWDSDEEQFYEKQSYLDSLSDTELEDKLSGYWRHGGNPRAQEAFESEWKRR